MNLKDRLRKILGSEVGAEPSADKNRSAGSKGDGLKRDGSVGDGSIGNWAKGSSLGSGTGSGAPGALRENEFGAYRLHVTDHALDAKHGLRAIGDGLVLHAERFHQLTGDPELARLDPGAAIYLDTETTSLSGGAGVTVFLVGVGFYLEGCFRVEQYFMDDYDQEPAMLHALNVRAAGFQALITYFGKNFDRYRLEDRMALNGVVGSLPVERHLDLYHTARRLYRGCFADLKLQTLEREVLAFHRKDDLPGSECPEAWFRFLRGEEEVSGNENRGRITDVFEHNRLDILSLAVLASVMDRVVGNPGSPREVFNVACAAERSGFPDRAAVLLDGILGLDGGSKSVHVHDSGPNPWDEDEALDAMLRRIRIAKRRKEITHLRGLLHEGLRRHPESWTIHMELAKYWEHRAGDPLRALGHAMRARELLEEACVGESARNVADAKHRVDRLLRKVEKR